MARPTLANPPRHQQLLASPKPRPDFRVFPVSEAEYHWRIVVLATNQTISRHKSLSFAIRKCTQLNSRSGRGASNDSN